VSDDLSTLQASDFAPFKAFCRDSKLPVFGMTAHVVYRAIDPDRPATTSTKVIADIIRGEIGFEGLLMSDDLGMKALTGPYDERAAASLAAGCDVVLHCDGNLADMEAVARGARPLDARGQAALAKADAIRSKPRGEIPHIAAAEFKVLNALRHG
jgi:beta-N-acetylhexosaminidase